MFLLVGALLLVSGWARADFPELRQPGVLYLEGNIPNTVAGKIAKVTTVYTERDFRTALGAFYPGQIVEIIGVGGDGYIVKGTVRGNSITGWIQPEFLPTDIDSSVFAAARANQKRRDAVAVAIANKAVIQGMTTDEVRQSLGRPDQTASRADGTGRGETWTFTTYEQQPQYSYALDARGRAYQQVYYVKVPVGRLSVEFRNGTVTAVEQQKTDRTSPGVVTN